MLFAALVALLLAVGMFFLAYGIGNYFIDNVYMSSDSVSARKAQIYTDFNGYVRRNNLAGTDAAAIASWTANRNYVTIIVTGRNGQYSVRRGEQTPVNNQISDLSALKGLTALRRLYLTGNPIEDYTCLNGLALEELAASCL